MRAKLLILPVVASGLLLLAQPAKAQCMSCNDVYTGCKGYSGSVAPSQCNGRLNCICGDALENESFETALHPGFTTRESGGQLTVSGVIPNSPAKEVGIRAGDVIVSVNGKRIGNVSCNSPGWESRPGAGQARLILRRGSSQREVVVRLVSVASLVSAQWIDSSSRPVLRPVGLKTVNSPDLPKGTFSIGVGLTVRQGQAEVTAVLRGSPADKAGIEVGDIIANQVSSNFEAGETPSKIELQVRRGDTVRYIALESEGISRILLAMAYN
jgi:membrane-associated protease RseP (regulator of RpoE activity)